MRKLFLTLFLVFHFLMQQSMGQEAAALLHNALAKCQSVQNGYLEADMFTKYGMSNDTFHLAVKGDFKKTENNTIFPILFHFDFDFQSRYNGSYLFTGHNFVTYSALDSSATLLSADIWPNRIRGYQTDKKIYMPFTSKNCFPLPQPADYLDGRHQFQLIGKENINGQPCFHVQMKETPQNESAEIQTLFQEYDYWIGDDSLPIQYVIRSIKADKLDSFHFYQKVILKNYRLNTIKTDSVFELTALPAYYTLKTYTEEKKIELLRKGSVAPQWTLYSLNGKKERLKDYRGKVVLLDFFYKSCYPCILSIPALSRLYDKYRNKGFVVLGIDPYDGKEPNELKQFVVKRRINYPVLVDDANRLGSTDHIYNVSVFPTAYIIDRKGKVIHVQEGYSEKAEQELDKIISDSLE